MSQAVLNTNQEWLKVLGKGMVTIPKKWRLEMGIAEGDIVRAKKDGDRVVIESLGGNLAPYRVYSDAEIDMFVKEDRLPVSLVKKVQKNLATQSLL